MLTVPLEMIVEITGPLNIKSELVVELSSPVIITAVPGEEAVCSELEDPTLLSLDGMSLGIVGTGTTMIDVLADVTTDPAIFVVVKGTMEVDSEHGQDMTMVFVPVVLEP